MIVACAPRLSVTVTVEPDCRPQGAQPLLIMPAERVSHMPPPRRVASCKQGSSAPRKAATAPEQLPLVHLVWQSPALQGDVGDAAQPVPSTLLAVQDPAAT